MSAVHTESLTIHLENHVSKSHLVYPAGQQNPQPGILVIPEFWGLSEHTKSRACRLAEVGYTALALDVYGDGFRAKTAKEATEAMNQLYSDSDKVSRRMLAYLENLKDLKQVDSTKTASIGYCLGGALSLHLARLSADVNAVVSFHGKLSPLPHDMDKKIKAKVLVCHGEADTMILTSDVENFKQEMNQKGADWQFVSYPEAKHGFTNPIATENGKKFNIPTAYNESADKASWNEMLNFFKKVF